MSLRHALLGLLNARSASGYDLVQTFNTSLVNVWPATQSQVYGELARLTAAGLLSVSDGGPRGRKEYSVTEAGRAELVHWLADTQPNRTERRESLLRVFFLGNLATDEAIAYLRQEEEVARRALAHLTEIEKTADWNQDEVAANGRLALEYGLRLMALRQDWSRWAIDQLGKRGKGAPKT